MATPSETRAKPRKAAKRGATARAKPGAKNGTPGRSTAIGVVAGLGAIAAGVAAALRFGLFDRLRPVGTAEHAAPDLAPGRPHPGPDARAPEAFRPDPTAPVTAAERDAFRPALVPTGFTEEKHAEAL
ncbi:hypothetical protein [Sphingomonas sp. NFR15]|uniref:hypothetical protein n=1 Tax=Sphingomonas sp. NFR15 TaxID=1566282 RepID=UPI000884D332|nr:hypothetical protein [Sphingomonas sp. NFR15]SDA36707.1 hypothetical protein SAMN03159340_03810 [Sphingomonas sp. NFR15]